MQSARSVDWFGVYLRSKPWTLAERTISTEIKPRESIPSFSSKDRKISLDTSFLEGVKTVDSREQDCSDAIFFDVDDGES
jgi:hypothetical protein